MTIQSEGDIAVSNAVVTMSKQLKVEARGDLHLEILLGSRGTRSPLVAKPERGFEERIVRYCSPSYTADLQIDEVTAAGRIPVWTSRWRMTGSTGSVGVFIDGKKSPTHDTIGNQPVPGKASHGHIQLTSTDGGIIVLVASD